MKEHAGWKYKYSEELKQKVALHLASGWLFCEDGTKYSPDELNVLREKIGKKYNIQSFELSQNYVAFYDKLEKCNYFLESVIKLLDKEKDDRLLSFILERGIEDGGQWDMFVNIVKKYGVVPQSVFAETYQSENTREIDNVLNRFLRKVSFKLRNSNSDEIDKIKEDAIDRVYKLLCSSFGVPPKSFSFEYVLSHKLILDYI